MNDERPQGGPADIAAGKRGSLLRNRDYLGWWVGDTVSGLGTALSGVAYPLLMLYETGSAAKAGAVAACGNLGMLATLLLGGVLADRYSRRALLVVGPLAQALAVATVGAAVLAGRVNVLHIAAVALVQGLVGGLTAGATRPALRRLVPTEQLPAALSQMHGREMAVRLAGPPLGGALFAAARWMPFVGDAASFCVGALGALAIRTPLGPDVDERTGRDGIWPSIVGGLRFIRDNAYLRFLTVWTALMNTAAAGLLLLLTVLVGHRGGGPAMVGVVMSIGAAGGLAGAFLAPVISRRLRGRTVFIALSWFVCIACVAMALVPAPWQIGAMLSLLFFFVAPLNVIFEAYEIQIIPDRLTGRVSSAIDFCAQSLRWVGPPAAGVLADKFGPVAAMLMLAGLFLVLALLAQFARALQLLNQPIGSVGPETTAAGGYSTEVQQPAVPGGRAHAESNNPIAG